jgi:arylsulfatase A-like enzyme
MKILIKILLLLLINASVEAQKKPNIILIFADDLGYMDCGFTGNKSFETPNIDALAQKGMVFRNAYAGAGNCAPSRAALLSGMYSPRHGVYAVGSSSRGDINKMRMVAVPNTTKLRPDIVTFGEALQQQGYATALLGKWHLGNTKETSPKAQGFDTFFDSQEPDPNNKNNPPNDPKGIYSLTDKSKEFISQNKDKPFFLYLAHHAIHSRLQARPLSIERFKNKGLDNKTALYAGCLYDLDDGVGQILKHLETLGLEENTLVIFTSDNGATQQSPQEPLRGSKGGYYEGGIREPFIAYWKGVTKAGAINETPIINLDLYPTFLDMAGASIPKNLDGESLLPLLNGKTTTTKRQSLFWHFPIYLDDPVIRGRDKDFRTRPVTVIRKGDWKLHLYHEEWLLDGGKKALDKNKAVELYNLKTDEGERQDVANSEKKKRDELLKDLLAWMKKTGAKMPTAITATNKPTRGNIDEDN